MKGRQLGRGRLVRTQDEAGRSVYRAEWTDDRGRRHRVNFGPDKGEAQRRLSKVIRERDLARAGMAGEDGLDGLFSQLVDDYLGDVKMRATAASHRTRSESLTLFIKLSGVVRVSDVNPLELQSFLRKRTAQGRSPRTINNDLVAIQACLNHAVRHGRLRNNPIAGVRRLPTHGKGKQLPRALSEEECVRLLAAAEQKDEAAVAPRPLLLRALLETGARWSELTTVTWSDIQWTPAGLRLRAECTKSRSERVIPLGPALVELLRQRAALDQPHASALVFMSPWGHAWGLPHNFRDWLYDVLKAADIARRDASGRVINVHALRHTFATRLARVGVPLQQAAYLTGHKTLSVLMQVYTHLQADDARQAIAALSLSKATAEVSSQTTPTRRLTA